MPAIALQLLSTVLCRARTAMPEESRHPSVGVIVPNHSRVESLLETLRSIAAQDYSGQVNVYLVYLERPEITEVISRLAPQVTAVPTLAQGLGAKRNLGLEAATEELVAFADDDDLWHPAKLRHQIDVMSATDVVGCCTRYVSFSRVPFEWPAPDGSPVVRSVSDRQIAFSSTIVVSSMICDGPLVRRLRFTERPDWRGVEDLQLWLRLKERGTIVCLEAPLTAMRIEHTSMSARGRVTQDLHALNVLANWHQGGKRGWVSTLALVRRTLDSAIARPGIDGDTDLRLLLLSYDGSLIGRRADRLVVALVRASWRSRIIAPALRWIRRQEYRIRLVLMPRPPMEWADERAREAQWGRDAP